MKNYTRVLVMAMALAVPFGALAGPGGPGGPGFGPGGGFPHPGYRVGILPDLATALVIGGLTYYVANGIYYQRQNDQYVVVEQPRNVNTGIKALDFNGKRYYVQDGHYYQRDIDGNYIEVPRPDGL